MFYSNNMKILDSTIVAFNIKERSHRMIALADFDIHTPNENVIYWIHCDLNHINDLTSIAHKVNLPDDVIALCTETDSLPKLIDTDETITIQLPALLTTEFDHGDEEIFGNLIIHLSNQYCFTATADPIPALLEFEKSYIKALRFAKTPCFILFLVIDNVVNDYAKILFSFELVTDQLDLKIREMTENIYNEVMDVKKQVMKIKRYTVAIREILMRISGRKISVISDQCRSSLYNLFNQSQMVFNEADSIRDILNGLLAQIDNILMQKMNEIMKVLTAFAAIFLPLTLITGIYGMNFHWIPELEWKYGYFATLGLLIFCGAALWYYFKKKKWF